MAGSILMSLSIPTKYILAAEKWTVEDKAREGGQNTESQECWGAGYRLRYQTIVKGGVTNQNDAVVRSLLVWNKIFLIVRSTELEGYNVQLYKSFNQNGNFGKERSGTQSGVMGKREKLINISFIHPVCLNYSVFISFIYTNKEKPVYNFNC